MQDFAPTTFSGHDLACRRGGRLVFGALGFAVQSGEVLMLRGANGSGKTTLLRLMAGLIRPTSGALAWNGEAVSELDLHAARLRFVGHLDAVKPALTVAENLAFWRHLWGGPSDQSLEQTAAALDLERLATFPARLLSAGQRHRLALARLAVAPAPLWLLDEPGNALDERSLAALTRLIAAHRARGGMVVLASHGDIGFADARVLLLDAFAAHEAHWSEAV